MEDSLSSNSDVSIASLDGHTPMSPPAVPRPPLVYTSDDCLSLHSSRSGSSNESCYALMDNNINNNNTNDNAALLLPITPTSPTSPSSSCTNFGSTRHTSTSSASSSSSSQCSNLEVVVRRRVSRLESETGDGDGDEREDCWPIGGIELSNVQLEVTVRLLEAEKRRLLILQRELEFCLSHPERLLTGINVDFLKQNIRRLQHHYEHLDQEYRDACKGVFILRTQLTKKSQRSQPAIGVKQTPKPRPSIFGTLTQAKSPTDQPKKRNRESVVPQMLSLAQMFGTGTGYVGSSDNNNTTTAKNNNNNNHHNDQDGDQALIFQNGNLHSGPLEALVQHLVPTSDYYPDRTYSFTFLLTSRLFIRPHELLAQVSQLCVAQQNLCADVTDNVITRSRLDKFGPHIVNLLSEWTEMFPYDFRDERMMKQLREITQRIIATFPELRKDINNLSYNLVTKLTNLKSYEENMNKLDVEEQRNTQTQIVPTTDMVEMCPSPLALAQQLTHIELERLSMIGPEEFVQAFSKERFNTEVSYQDMKSTHNLEAYVQWFNRLSYLVASEITSHMKKKCRVRMIEYFIDVAKECINIGNFNSLMAIIAGMNLGAVTRLKKTWAKLNKDKLKILEHQMDPSNNFGSYRSCLKAAMWRSQGAADDRERIVIPFFSLFVKDLYFLNEGCNSRQEDGTVNFQKCWQMAKQISDLIAWQHVECPFERNDHVINYVLTTPVYKESTLSLASYECEAPENNYDRERCKQLKSETPSSPL